MKRKSLPYLAALCTIASAMFPTGHATAEPDVEPSAAIAVSIRATIDTAFLETRLAAVTGQMWAGIEAARAASTYVEDGYSELAAINDLYDDVVPVPDHGEIAVESALTQIGVGYRYATAEPGVAFDCSGLTKWAWEQAGVELPHKAAEQYRTLPKVDVADIRPGDLIVNRSLSHVVMYVGDGQIIHAVSEGKPVEVKAWDQDRYDMIVRPG